MRYRSRQKRNGWEQRKKAWGLIILLGFLSTAELVSQTSAPAPASALTFDELASAVRTSFKDSSEFHVLQKITFTAVDSRGRVRKQRQGSLNYLFQGFNVNSRKAIVGEMSIDSFGELWSVMVRGLWKLGMTDDFWATRPIETVLRKNARAQSTFRASRAVDNQSLVADLGPTRECPAFTMAHQQAYYWPDLLCGSHQYYLDPDLTLLRYRFAAAGLPAQIKIKPFGRCVAASYQVDVEYHKVRVLQSPNPFLVPKRVVVTLATDKGNIVIASDYYPTEGVSED